MQTAYERGYDKSVVAKEMWEKKFEKLKYRTLLVDELFL